MLFDKLISFVVSEKATLSDAIRLYDRQKLAHKSPKYRIWCLGRLGDVTSEKPIRRNSLLRVVGDKPMEYITIDDLQGWANALKSQTTTYRDTTAYRPEQVGGLSPDTINGYRSCLNTFWKWCVRHKEVPIRFDLTTAVNWNLRVLPADSRPVEAISDEAARQLLDLEKNLRDEALIRFMMFTGARACECVSLTWDRLHIYDRAALLMGKGNGGENKPRWVVFDKKTSGVLHDYHTKHRVQGLQSVFVSFTTRPPTGGLTYDGVYQLVQRLKKRAGIIEPVSPHRLRHWWATKSAELRADNDLIQLQMGHEDFSTTQRYIKYSAAALRKKYDAAWDHFVLGE